MVVSKGKAAWESAVRTFLQAALPAFAGSLVATDGAYTKSVILAAAMAALAAGLAAITRAVKPLQTDAAGVSVVGVDKPISPPAH